MKHEHRSYNMKHAAMVGPPNSEIDYYLLKL